MEEEYKMLREEIVFNTNKIHWYISIVSTVGLALLAYIIVDPRNVILLTLFLAVLVIIEGRILGLTKSIIVISTYMETFLEPELNGRNWETKLHDKELKFKKRPLLNFLSNTNSICFLIGIIIMVYNCITIWENISILNVTFSIINLLLVLILAYMAFLNMNGYQDRESHLKSWENLKKTKKPGSNSRDEV